ncbi:MAG: sulfotransferase, partial [Planctomycetaceae bacterium]
MPRRPIPVFVVGCGRSGTTVTARLLNHLPGVHIAKETGYLNQHLPLLQQIKGSEVPEQLLLVVNSWLQTNDWTGRASAPGFADFCRRHNLSGAPAFIHY